MVFCIAFYLDAVHSHVCLLIQRSKGNVLKWSLPYSEICYCQIVLQVEYISECPLGEIQDGDLFFLEELQPLRVLLVSKTWTKETVDVLLNRTEYCGKITNIRNVYLSCPSFWNMVGGCGCNVVHGRTSLCSLVRSKPKGQTSSEIWTWSDWA